MKAIVLSAALLAATLVGTAVGAPQGPPDDSATHIDLSRVGGPVLYLKCDFGTGVGNCRNPTLWQESNDLGNLQSNGLVTEKRHYDPDARLLM
jgi:hypothetical protein